jgi:hypothetical protein
MAVSRVIGIRRPAAALRVSRIEEGTAPTRAQAVGGEDPYL